MKINRKALSALIAAIMILSISGCAESSNQDTKKTPEAETTASQNETPESKEETAAVTGAVSESQPDESQPAVTTAADTTPAAPSGFGSMTSGLTYDPSTNCWSTTDEEYSKFVKIMQRECSKSEDIRGTYLLATDDKILFIGSINSKETDGVSNTNAFTTYEIGHLTAVFTSTAVLQLCEKGAMSLDDTLDKYFPGFEKGKKITIKDILCAKSGLQTAFIPSEEYTDGTNYNIEIIKKYENDGYTASELLSKLFSSDLAFEPGTQVQYSNAGFTLLAMIIEQVSGMEYSEYIKENIFKVCGMAHSSSMTIGDVTSVPETPPKDLYPFDVSEITEDGYTKGVNVFKGSGDIHSCASDLLAFDRALMGGKLLNEDSMEKMFDMEAKEKPYNCGWLTFGYWQPEVVGYQKGVYFGSGSTYCYVSNNLVCQSDIYGNVYLIQLHSNIADSGLAETCATNIAMAVKY